MKRANEVLVKVKRGNLKAEWVRERAERILDILGVEGVELSVLITDDEEMRYLNHLYRGKDRPTDVLSFPMGDEVGGRVILGDVVVSADMAKERTEVERLLIHGIIHLLGYDHERGDEEEELFRSMENKVLGELSRCVWKT
ncbi:MAG TPA: rRNA maturation RNase YbeY [Aquificaceae bacterium]|nr:rRNA maturation RNase YbeY [Aquificaceae bacterium]